MIAISEPGRLADSVKEEIKTVVLECLDSGFYILGSNVSEFEKEFASYLGLSHCVSAANGTDALEISLKAVGVGPGDRVITAANAGFYGSSAVFSCGASPLYADIDPLSYNVDVDSIADRDLNFDKVKAFIVTHLYGRMSEVEKIKKFCKERHIYMIEDCAQAHGAEKNGIKAGKWGDVSCFSFYPTKNLGAAGDAGAVATDNAEIAERIKKLRQYGWRKKYQIGLRGGINSRMDEVQAAVLRVKLKYLDKWNEERRSIASFYNAEINNPGVVKKSISDKSYVAHLYVVETEKRKNFMEHLLKSGIPCDIHYPIPDHKQENNREEYSGCILPETETICERVVTLPCFPGMTESELKKTAEAVNNWKV